MRIPRATIVLAALICACALPLWPALAQSYPAKPLRIIVPYAPGGSVDLTGRLVAQGLQQGMGQPALVENRAGAGGAIGTDVVAKATPDGHTLLVVAPGAMTVISHFQKILYDPVKDFAAVTSLAVSPLLLSVNTALPVNNVNELIAYTKTQASSVNFSSTGPGSLSVLAGELFKMMTGARLTVVTYNGGAPAAAAIASGEVSFGITDSAPVFPHVSAGKVRILALTEPKRVPSKPDIPTVAESVSGYEVASWTALFAPAGTAPAIVNRLHAEIVKLFNTPEIRDRALKVGMDPSINGPEAMGKMIRDDFDKWRKLVASTGLKAQ